MSKISLLSLPILLVACSSSPSNPDGNVPPCPSGNCGQESFRRAVPTRGDVRVQHPTGGRARSAKVGSERPPIKNPGQLHLDALSPALVAVDDEITEIDLFVDEVFTELEASSSTPPEVESDTEHVWRAPNADLAGHEDVLRVTTADGATFQIDYAIVPAGGDPETVTPVVSGEVRLADDDDVLDFDLDVDLGAYTELDPSFQATGIIRIAAMPPANGGLSEHWFDFEGVSFDGGPVETSLTTAWAYGDGDGALEYVADIDGAQTTVYARWDARGGRYDHHSEYVDPDFGLIDEIVTNCWDVSGGETFDAFAVIDQNLDYYGELDGAESSCAFGPVEDHPDPGADFENLPADGEWEKLELFSYCDVSSAC